MILVGAGRGGGLWAACAHRIADRGDAESEAATLIRPPHRAVSPPPPCRFAPAFTHLPHRFVAAVGGVGAGRCPLRRAGSRAGRWGGDLSCPSQSSRGGGGGSPSCAAGGSCRGARAKVHSGAPSLGGAAMGVRPGVPTPLLTQPPRPGVAPPPPPPPWGLCGALHDREGRSSLMMSRRGVACSEPARASLGRAEGCWASPPSPPSPPILPPTG